MAAAPSGTARPSMRDVASREKKSGGTGSSAVGTGGFAGYKKAKTARSEKFPRFEVGLKPKLFRFAEAEPFAFIYRHWAGKRPYTCIADPENEIECPLCEAGDRAKPVVFYNVIDVETADLMVWEMSTEPTRKVQSHYDRLADMEPPRTLDAPGQYFAVHKEKKDNNFFEFTVTAVKERDFEDDWPGAEPLTDEEIAKACEKLFTDQLVRVNTAAELREAVSNIED